MLARKLVFSWLKPAGLRRVSPVGLRAARSKSLHDAFRRTGGPRPTLHVTTRVTTAPNLDPLIGRDPALDLRGSCLRAG